MKAYLHRNYCGLGRNYCGLGDRIIIHPRGLPPGWTESNLSKEGQERALAAAEGIYTERRGVTDESVLKVLRRRSPDCRKFTINRHGNVLHLNPETLELVEALPLQ
jgi:hypothetical protein